MIGGTCHPGSGNRIGWALDASGHTIVVSGKYVDSQSFSVLETDLDEMLRATVGPEALRSSTTPVLAARYRSGRSVAVMDLMQLIEWIKAPPALLPSSRNETVRHTARVPPHLRTDAR